MGFLYVSGGKLHIEGVLSRNLIYIYATIHRCQWKTILSIGHIFPLVVVVVTLNNKDKDGLFSPYQCSVLRWIHKTRRFYSLCIVIIVITHKSPQFPLLLPLREYPLTCTIVIQLYYRSDLSVSLLSLEVTQKSTKTKSKTISFSYIY